MYLATDSGRYVNEYSHAVTAAWLYAFFSLPGEVKLALE